MENPPERRRLKRVRLPDRHGNLVVSLAGAVLDISLSGMAVETNTRLAPQRTLTLRLGNGGRSLQLTGRVVWCFLHGTQANAGGEQLPVYRAGIHFTDVLSPQAQELLKFLESHAIVTLDTRLFGRFRIADGDPVEVSASSHFRVLELDGDGLTVETPHAPEPRSVCEVELQLDAHPLTARTQVLEAIRLPRQGEEAWHVKLAFVDLPEPDRAHLNDFLRGELGAEEE